MLKVYSVCSRSRIYYKKRNLNVFQKPRFVKRICTGQSVRKQFAKSSEIRVCNKSNPNLLTCEICKRPLSFMYELDFKQKLRFNWCTFKYFTLNFSEIRTRDEWLLIDIDIKRVIWTDKLEWHTTNRQLHVHKVSLLKCG